MRRFTAFALALILAGPAITRAGFDEGVAAYKANDYAKALGEWFPLAQQGSADAQWGMALMYDAGNGVVQDTQEALKWYRLAAQQGHMGAQIILAKRYKYGDGVVQDSQEALKWNYLAAQHGFDQAQYEVGRMYLEGEGVAQDKREAVKWLRLSAAQGHESALMALSHCYQAGTGVAQNLPVAYALAAQKTPDGIVQYMLSSLTADQIKAGQDLTSELQKSKDFLGTLDAYVARSLGSP